MKDTTKQKLLKIIEWVIYIFLFIIGSVLNKVMVVDGEDLFFWIFVPLIIYNLLRTKLNIPISLIGALVGTAISVFGFVALISK